MHRPGKRGLLFWGEPETYVCVHLACMLLHAAHAASWMPTSARFACGSPPLDGNRSSFTFCPYQHQCMHAYTHAPLFMYVCIYMHVYTRACMYIHTHLCVCIHTYIYAYTYINFPFLHHMHMYIHMCSPLAPLTTSDSPGEPRVLVKP